MASASTTAEVPCVLSGVETTAMESCADPSQHITDHRQYRNQFCFRMVSTGSGSAPVRVRVTQLLGRGAFGAVFRAHGCQDAGKQGRESLFQSEDGEGEAG